VSDTEADFRSIGDHLGTKTSTVDALRQQSTEQNGAEKFSPCRRSPRSSISSISTMPSSKQQSTKSTGTKKSQRPGAMQVSGVSAAVQEEKTPKADRRVKSAPAQSKNKQAAESRLKVLRRLRGKLEAAEETETTQQQELGAVGTDVDEGMLAESSQPSVQWRRRDGRIEVRSESEEDKDAVGSMDDGEARGGLGMVRFFAKLD